MVTTILEFWNGEWWRWYLLNGRPYAFTKEVKLEHKVAL